MRHVPTHRRVAVAVGLVVGALSSCGGGASTGGLDTEDKAYADAMVTSMQLDPGSPFNEAESRCLAEGTVSIIGADTFAEWEIGRAHV